MLHTTFAKAKKSSACEEGYRKLAKYLGGVKKYGENTPISLTTIIESNGIGDAIWALRCTVEDSNYISREFACRCTEHVLHYYEDKYPNDNRLRKAIEVTRKYISDSSPDTLLELLMAQDGAWNVVRYLMFDFKAWVADTQPWAVARAAWDIARYEAWDAAWSSSQDAILASSCKHWDDTNEKEWQKQALIELLNEVKCQ